MLEEYRRKRDPKRTPEPEGKRQASDTGRLFVVQKHRATQLHYDLRLELDGVLLSWAVPKGPSLDPSEKRLAVQVEDHPVKYGSFEGVIPEEEYGGGTVLLWDRGEWSPWADPKADLEKGTLKFDLHGQKLRGGWTLVRMKEKGLPTKNWLLIKERDDAATSEDVFSIADEEPFSVISGRSIPEIAAAPQAVWGKDKKEVPTAQGGLPWRRGIHANTDLNFSSTKGARKAKPPRKLEQIEPIESEDVPAGDDWLHEIHPPGLRLICSIEENAVTLESTDGKDLTRELPELARAVSRLPIASAIVDGVLRFPGAQGSDVAAIEEAIRKRQTNGLEYHAFDLIYGNGFDLRGCELSQRKALLQSVLASALPPVVYSDHVAGHGQTVFAEAQKLKVAAILSRQATSTYPPRAGEWVLVHLAQDSGASSRRRAAAAASADVEIRGVKLTHPNRVLYPEERVTKRMLAAYYEAIAERMLPHVAARPLSIVRCPDGIEKEAFFQKQLGGMTSEHLRDAGEASYITLRDVRGLIMLAQWSTVEIHAWGCREDDPEKPDRVIFDLDPGPGVSWPQIVEGAKGLRFLLGELGLTSFVKTSGGKGLHVYVPLARRADWDEVKDFSAKVARHIAGLAPKHFTVLMSKPERKGKVFIDYFRNQREATCAAPYSTRARPGANVSLPIDWSELDGGPLKFHIFEALERAQSSDDPWWTLLTTKQALNQARSRLIEHTGNR